MIFMRVTVPPELGYQPSDFGEIMAKNCVTSRKGFVHDPFLVITNLRKGPLQKSHFLRINRCMLVQGLTREIFESKRQNGQFLFKSLERIDYLL